jgi:hypothetical protein
MFLQIGHLESEVKRKIFFISSNYFIYNFYLNLLKLQTNKNIKSLFLFRSLQSTREPLLERCCISFDFDRLKIDKIKELDLRKRIKETIYLSCEFLSLESDL